MKISVVLSMVWLAMSLSFSGGLTNDQRAVEEMARLAATHQPAPAGRAAPAKVSTESVAEQFVVLSYI
jgi:hypothetical protein